MGIEPTQAASRRPATGLKPARTTRPPAPPRGTDTNKRGGGGASYIGVASTATSAGQRKSKSFSLDSESTNDIVAPMTVAIILAVCIVSIALFLLVLHTLKRHPQPDAPPTPPVVALIFENCSRKLVMESSLLDALNYVQRRFPDRALSRHFENLWVDQWTDENSAQIRVSVYYRRGPEYAFGRYHPHDLQIETPAGLALATCYLESNLPIREFPEPTDGCDETRREQPGDAELDDILIVEDII